MWNPVPNTLRIGIVLALSASNQTLQATLVRKGLSAIRLAVEDVNRLKMIPGINVSLIVRDSLDPSLFTNTGGLAAITATGDLMSAKVGGVIGDISSAVTRFEALITSSVDLWQCSYASVDTLLSDISTYPSFFRTVPTIFLEIDAILHMAVHLGWKRILIIYDMVSLGWTGREYIAAKASQLGIYILGYQPLSPDGVTVDPTYQAVKEGIRSYQSRVQVVITNGIEQLPLIREMSDSGFFGPDYGWVTLSDISFLMQQDKNIRNYDGMIMVDNGWDLNGYGPFDTFQEEWVALNATDYPGAGDPQLSRNEGMAYSCVMMFAEAYGKLVRASTSNTSNLIQDIISGAHTGQINMSQTFGNMSYEGPSGPITLDSNGDRTSGNYVMMTMYNGTAVLFASSLSGDYVQSRPPLFKEGYPDLPNDTPLGAIQNPRWDNVNGIIYGVFCILGILLTLAAMMAVIYFRKHIVLKAASPIFCLYELFGVLLIIVWCTLHVGIPNEAVCIVQAFNLPLGVTFLAGSLTIKNYRIYRIFNSVTATNLAFQTRVLIRYLGLAVVLCLIPVIVQVIVDPPSPQKLNIQSYQWIRCTGTYAQTIWTVLNSIVPMALLFFGVFLAIKTRNVVFLWNEARQISLVLYNVSFFAILVIISRIFPPSLYPANFYIASIGALFVVLVTLIVLFAPKFWNIWNDLHKGRGKERYYNNFNNRTPHLGIRGAGGSDDHSITVGPGGLGGDASGAIFGRMPEDLKFALPPTVQPTTEGEQQEQQRQQQEEVASTNSAVGDFDLSNIAFDRSELGASSHEPSATTTVERVPAIATTTEVSRSESRSESHPESLSSFSDIINRRQAKSKDNPLNAWMKSRIPRKESVVVGNTHKIDEVETLQNQGGAEEQRSVHEPNSSGAGHLESEAAASAGVSVVAMATTAEYAPEGPLNVDTQSGSVFEGASLGASNILDSYVFLLPIFVIRNRIARILSHWSMTTIILIPEAHAFLAVDHEWSINKLLDVIHDSGRKRRRTHDPNYNLPRWYTPHSVLQSGSARLLEELVLPK
ncbi:periplasmic binding protein-like I [Dissophora ornata]|nr:periplasmic binding protein-like I [Dissophora ornata]